jgi:hydroxypyruvate reductase
MPATMPPQVLQIAAYGDAFLTKVDADHGLVRSVGKDPLTTLSDVMRAPIRALLTMGSVGATETLMQGLPNLGLICCFGSGYEKVDVAAALRRGIAVTHSPGANASSVADMAVTMLLASIRRTISLDQFVRSGAWTDLKAGRPPTVRGLTGLKVGIVGLGDIGRRIAHRIAAFETVVGYHNRNRRADVSYHYEPTLLGLARWADALVIACRADASNRNMIDARVLAALGADGHIVNISSMTLPREMLTLCARCPMSSLRPIAPAAPSRRSRPCTHKCRPTSMLSCALARSSIRCRRWGRGRPDLDPEPKAGVPQHGTGVSR